MGQLFETLGLNIIHGNDRKTFDIVFYKLRYLKNPKKAAIILNNWNERFEREKMDIVLSVSENSYLRMAALKINFVGDKTAHKVCEMSTHLLKLYVNMIQKEYISLLLYSKIKYLAERKWAVRRQTLHITYHSSE